MTTETWRPVIGLERSYEVSDHGHIRSLLRDLVLRPYVMKKGYLYVDLALGRKKTRRRVLVHRLVLETFVGPCPAGMECAHLDGVRSNCSLSNLAWKTPVANQADKLLHGTQLRGELHQAARLTEADVIEIRTCGLPDALLARKFGVSSGAVRLARRGESWKHVAIPPDTKRRPNNPLLRTRAA